MLLELVTCAFAVFGTLSCDDGDNADAAEKFQELVLAYEEVLETKGDKKLRGLKDIHQQLDEIATRYPDADVTAKILSSNIVGINLSRVERAIQKLDPDFNKQTETIVVGDVSSSHEVMEAPYNDLIVQMASVPHMPKNLPIEVKAAPQQELLVVSTAQQPPITLPTAKPKRETPVVVADIPLPIAKPEVQSRKQPVKQLASSLPTTADWNMLFVPTAFSGGSSFKSSSTWNNLGPQRSLAAIVPNQVILAQVETDALGDEKVVDEDRKAEANDASWYLAMGYSTPIWESKAWDYNNGGGNSHVVSHQNKEFSNTDLIRIGIGRGHGKWGYELLYEESGKAKWEIGETVRRDGQTFDSGYLDFQQRNLMFQMLYKLAEVELVETSLLLGVGKTEFKVGAGQLVKDGILYPQGDAHTENVDSYRLGLVFEKSLSNNVSILSQLNLNDYGKIHNKDISTGDKNYFVPRKTADASILLKYYFSDQNKLGSEVKSEVVASHDYQYFGEVRLANSFGDSVSWEDTVSGNDKFSSINNPKTENGLGYGIAIGKNIGKYRTAIVLEQQPATDFVTDAVTTAGGTTYQKLKVPLDITTAMIEAERDVISIPKGNVFLLGGIGQSQVKSGAMVYTTNSGETISGQNHTSSNTAFRYGLGLTHRLGESVILKGTIQNTSHGEIFTKTPEGTTPFSFKLDSHDFTIGVQKHF